MRRWAGVGDEAPEEARTLAPLFPFSSEPAATVGLWERIDDVVMGGVSSSRVVAGEARAEWRGIVRTDGGGFCGARTVALEEPMDLSGFEGLYVDARVGKGRSFLTLRAS